MPEFRSIDVGRGSELTAVGPAPGPDEPTDPSMYMGPRSIDEGRGSEETCIGPAPLGREAEPTEQNIAEPAGNPLISQPRFGTTEIPTGSASESMPGGVMAGQVLDGRFRLVRRIGTGGMSEVWEAYHTVIRRPLAVKVVTLGSDQGSQDAGARLLREAKAIARIEHANVIEIVDFGRTPQGLPFLVMELLRGESLEDLLKREGPLRWERAKELGLQVISALMAAHGAGVLHRDVKPGNIWVRPTAMGERCKLLDFGISRVRALAAEETAVTQAGTLIGTPAYMSPEQIHGNFADVRSDVYAMGAVLHALLAGEGPFDARTTAETLYRQIYEEPIPVRLTARGPEIPPSIEAVVLRCLRKHPELRFPTMSDLKSALEAAGTGASVTLVPTEDLPQPEPELRARYETVHSVQAPSTWKEPPVAAASTQRGRGLGFTIGLTAAAVACVAGAALVTVSSLSGRATAEAPDSQAADMAHEAVAPPRIPPQVEPPPQVAASPTPAPPPTVRPAVDDAPASEEEPVVVPTHTAPAPTTKRKKKTRARPKAEASTTPPPAPSPTPAAKPQKPTTKKRDADLRDPW